MQKEKFLITFDPSGIIAEAFAGEILSDVAVRAGVRIDHHCGGVGACGKCRVRDITGSPLGALTVTEQKFFSREEAEAGFRLACCAIVTGSGRVEVCSIPDSAGSKILQEFSGHGITEWQPDCGKYGIAVDIGTTTVVCYLLDLEVHREVDCCSFLNPQVSFGDDVISRISYTSRSQQALTQLQSALIVDLDEAISGMARKNGISARDITQIVVAGNTVMEHIFVGTSPESIGHSPYAPQFLTHVPIMASELGLHISDRAVVKLLPNVAGYVGADIVAGVSAYGMDKESRTSLLIDIGTNNEIVIGNCDGLFCCATAAGPALEGARIQYGMRASTGAIEKVVLANGELLCSTIGGVSPKGLCGSGLIDAIALLVKNGVIDKRGRLLSSSECMDDRFSHRIDRDASNMGRILLTDNNHPVYLTQKDIREVQLAIGAIKVGVDVMLESAGKKVEDVDEVLLAGAFGCNIDIMNSIFVGLLPNVERNKIRSIRNASGYGASLALASARFFDGTKETAAKMSYVELSSLTDFQKRFINAMLFDR